MKFQSAADFGCATLRDMAIEGKRFVDEVVRVADLFTTQDVLDDLEFENCLLFGPGVVLPVGAHFDSCSFEGTPASLAWPIPSGGMIVGAFVFRNARFYRCRFLRLGFAGNETFRADFIKGLSGG